VVVPSPPPSRRGVSLSFLCAFMISAGHANDSGVRASLCVGLAASLAGDGRNAKYQGLNASSKSLAWGPRFGASNRHLLTQVPIRKA
jgi:hypothetical protein